MKGNIEMLRERQGERSYLKKISIIVIVKERRSIVNEENNCRLIMNID